MAPIGAKLFYTLMKKLLYIVLLLTNINIHADNHVIAKTILLEARGEGDKGMAAVACVIAQRAKNRGMSPEAVCLQPKQFSCWNGKSPDSFDELLKCPQAKMALWLEANIYRMNTKKIGDANHYHADYVKPYWSKGVSPVIKIGRHVFYRL